jgi:hypothetical protein
LWRTCLRIWNNRIPSPFFRNVFSVSTSSVVMPGEPLRCPHCGAYDVSASGATCTCAYCGTTFSLIGLHDGASVSVPERERTRVPFMVCASCETAYAEGEWAQCVEADVTPHMTQTTSSWSVRCRSYLCPSCGGPICRECVAQKRWGGPVCKRCGTKIASKDGAFVVSDKKEIPLMLRKYLR